MVTVFSRFRVRNGMEAEMRAALLRRSHRVEHAPGFLGFAIHTDADDPAVFFLETRWASRADFQAWHGSEDHRRTFRHLPAGIKLDARYTRITVMEPVQGGGEPVGPGGLDASLEAAVAAYAGTSPDLHLLVLDRRGRILRANAGAASWLGRTAEELRGLPLESLVASHDEESLAAALRARDGSCRSMRLSLVDCTRRPYALDGLLRIEAEQAVLVGTPSARDLHELQHRLLELNNEMTALARESERRQRRLAAAKLDLQRTVEELHHSSRHLRRIQEMVPVCLGCGQPRAGAPGWRAVTRYLKDQVPFHTQGLCPLCRQEAPRGCPEPEP